MALGVNDMADAVQLVVLLWENIVVDVLELMSRRRRRSRISETFDAGRDWNTAVGRRRRPNNESSGIVPRARRSGDLRLRTESDSCGNRRCWVIRRACRGGTRDGLARARAHWHACGPSPRRQAEESRPDWRRPKGGLLFVTDLGETLPRDPHDVNQNIRYTLS